MIYMVECAFTDPAREDEWNVFYGGDKLTTLLALPGFRASQRFRAITPTKAPYLAVHSIRDASVLDQNIYRDVGGGTFSGWDDLVTNWDRNLFDGLETAPDVSSDDCLVLLDDRKAERAVPGVSFTWLHIAGLDRTVAQRGFAVVDGGTGNDLADKIPDSLHVFAPLAGRRVSPHGLNS